MHYGNSIKLNGNAPEFFFLDFVEVLSFYHLRQKLKNMFEFTSALLLTNTVTFPLSTQFFPFRIGFHKRKYFFIIFFLCSSTELVELSRMFTPAKWHIRSKRPYGGDIPYIREVQQYSSS